MSDGVTVNLICCTQVILQDIAEKKATQKDVALTYAMAIKSEYQKADIPDWRTINNAILKRWKHRGLNNIKKLAWEILRERTQR